jgi:hypothetical protein
VFFVAAGDLSPLSRFTAKEASNGALPPTRTSQ